MDIRCRKLNCKFNDHFTCRAKSLSITKTAVCKTYVYGSEKKEIDTTKNLFEKTPYFAPMRDSKTLEIKCNAKCIMNHEGVCIANGITMNDYKLKPCCLTFLEE